MSDDERVLRSFVAEDEDLLGCWTVTKIERSKGRLPPAGGERTLAVTTDRVLWFTSELEAIERDGIDSAELEYVERESAPPLVLAGGLLFALGGVGSIAAFVLNVGDSLVVAMPVLTGLLAFLATRLIAGLTDRQGTVRAGQRLRLSTDGGPVSIWGQDESLVSEIEAAIAGDSSDETDGRADDRDGGDETSRERSSTTADDVTITAGDDGSTTADEAASVPEEDANPGDDTPSADTR